MLLIDAHVHIYDCFDLKKFFDSAYANFKCAAERLGYGNDFTGILLLAETSKENWFRRLSDYTDGKNLPEGKDAGNWIFRRTDETNSLHAASGDSKNLILIAGRQIVTGEDLEIIALSTTERFKDSTPIKKMIEDIKNRDGVPVIPWGFGKWIGRRGKILKALIETSSKSDFFLGDNSGRPAFIGNPSLFKLSDEKGIRTLPGTDPLPLKNGDYRSGSYGFTLINALSSNEPGKDLRNYILNHSAQFEKYGRSERFFLFVLNQIRMRLKRDS